ncbi:MULTISPECIES: hypothetical protein [unclassified Rhizobium]|uniref:hypothetical protein n=1 Tax=unclassified Rhizobium TaxID=2613769 RepID=UPI0012E30CE1|nr:MULTISPECIES: hypothetical protein [unclassified Rhizobium]
MQQIYDYISSGSRLSGAFPGQRSVYRADDDEQKSAHAIKNDKAGRENPGDSQDRRNMSRQYSDQYPRKDHGAYFQKKAHVLQKRISNAIPMHLEAGARLVLDTDGLACQTVTLRRAQLLQQPSPEALRSHSHANPEHEYIHEGRADLAVFQSRTNIRH